jgi:membrane associated rhomboid family serine protease
MSMDDREWYQEDSERGGVGFGGAGVRWSFGPKTPPFTKWLCVALIAVYIAQLFVYLFTQKGYAEFYLEFSPERAVGSFEIWRFITYAFLHAAPFHLLINLLIFWMFSREVEMRLGGLQFMVFFIFCALGGAFLTCYVPSWFASRTVGASGAILGILAAWLVFWPNRTVLLMFLFPIKVKWLVLIVAALDMAGAIRPGFGDATAHLAHLGGFGFGFLFLLLVPALDRLGYKLEARRGMKEAAAELEIREKVDMLLDKINREGINSLTESERKFLTDSSKRFHK